MRQIRYLKSVLHAVAVLAVGAFMSPVSAATYVYVGNAESNDIDVLQLDPKTGDLTAVEKVAIPNVAKPGPTSPIAITPDKRFLHMAIRTEPYVVASFAIDPATGKLKHLGNGALNDAMAYIVTDRAGGFLLAASYPGNRFTVNPIAPDGTVYPPQQVVAGIPNAHEIFPDPANRFVIGTSLGSDRVFVYRFDAKTGDLQPNDPPFVATKEKSGPRHFRFHPDGKIVFLLCELDATLYVFDYDADKGTLAQKQVVDTLQAGYTGKVWAADLHLTPDGKFLYVSERGTSTLAAFSVAPDGKVTLIDHYPTEQQPRGFNIDPSGRYLLAVGQLSNGMSSYAIDGATGVLTRLKQYPVGKNPNWVEIVDLP
jgi:6-phosphogluconolactonase